MVSKSKSAGVVESVIEPFKRVLFLLIFQKFFAIKRPVKRLHCVWDLLPIQWGLFCFQ